MQNLFLWSAQQVLFSAGHFSTLSCSYHFIFFGFFGSAPLTQLHCLSAVALASNASSDLYRVQHRGVKALISEQCYILILELFKQVALLQEKFRAFFTNVVVLKQSPWQHKFNSNFPDFFCLVHWTFNQHTVCVMGLSKVFWLPSKAVRTDRHRIMLHAFSSNLSNGCQKAVSRKQTF